MKVIARQTIRDNEFPDHLDFDVLRKEAMGHLAELSGSVWTDHNVHDPGITIMELLIFSLMDIGYRSQLPIEDLLADDPNAETALNNFFSPAQILSNNPTTILDYRKMLIDVPGVKNAWLEKTDAEQALCLDRENNKLTSCTEIEGDDAYQVELNGLYKVTIQLEPEIQEKKNEQQVSEIITTVKERLHDHRNLGEDFTEICVLCICKIKLCIDVEITEDADPNQVYVWLTDALQDFFCPPIPFYSLQELLDRKEPIASIFEGRPYGLDSFGFIRSEELEQAKKIKEIHVSDLYKVVQDVSGVSSINTLDVKICKENGQESVCDPWIIQLPADHAPVYCRDTSNIVIKRNRVVIPTDKTKIRKFQNQVLKTHTKTKYLDPEQLDKTVPNGKYRSDLSQYYSIQNDLPRVYGIREGGLPAKSTDKRKAQALQLKSFLLFFDRLFIDYLNQLSRVGQLFSLNPDVQKALQSEDQYIDYQAAEIPEVEKLVKFYRTSGENNVTTLASTLAYPVDSVQWLMQASKLSEDQYAKIDDLESYDFLTIRGRRIAINHFKREFAQREYSIDVYGYSCHYFFVVTTSYDDVVLLSHHMYETEEKARIAADQLVLLGTLKESYRIEKAEDFTFELIDDPALYPKLAARLTPNTETKRDRRHRFLDHLLARFSDQFVDYSMVLYRQHVSASEDYVDKKTAFLSQYDNYSRNRGRAFNYCKPYWQTDNRSGLQAQVMARLGYEQNINKRLCNFEVRDLGPEFQIVLKYRNAELLAVSKLRFKTKEKAGTALNHFIESFAKNSKIRTIDDTKANHFSFELVSDAVVFSAVRSFSTATGRDRFTKVIPALFSPAAGEDEITVTEYIYFQELKNDAGQSVRRSKRSYETEVKAERARATFIRHINKQDKLQTGELRLNLVADQKDNTKFIDRSTASRYFVYEDFVYRWVLSDPKNLCLLKSTQTYHTGKQAGDALAKILQDFTNYRLSHEDQRMLIRDSENQTIAQSDVLPEHVVNDCLPILDKIIGQHDQYGGIIQKKNRAYSWHLENESGVIILSGTALSRNKRKAEKQWRQCKDREKGKLEIIRTVIDKCQIGLYDPAGILWAISPEVSLEQVKTLEDEIKERLSTKQNINFRLEQEAYGYRVLDSEDYDTVLFESYDLFTSPGAALDTLSQTLKRIKKTVHYYETGDEANLNYSFSMQDRQDRFVVAHPATYATAGERDAVMARTQEEIEQLRLPIQLIKESPFWMTDGLNKIMKSTVAFEQLTEAQDHFYQFMHRLRDEKACRVNKKARRVEVYDNNILLAHSPEYETTDTYESVVDRLLHLADEHLYYTDIVPEPHRWAYQMHWQNAAGHVEKWIQSINTYTSKSRAEKAYTHFAERLNDIQVTKDEQNNRIVFRLDNARKPFAYYPHHSDELLRDDTKQDIQRHIEFLQRFKKQIGEEARRKSEWIERTPESKTGNYIYRLAKNHDPIAFAPCDCIQRPDDNHDTMLDAYRKIWMTPYTYCDFCLAGDIVVQIGMKYHYVFRHRTSGVIYLISACGYDSHAEAQEAFQAHFFEIVELASDPGQYGDRIHLGEISENGNGICTDANTVIAYVPKACLSEFDRKKWALCFCSYPIRRCAKKRQKDQSCRDFTPTYEYYFQLLKPDAEVTDDCKIAWKSTLCFSTPELARKAFHQFQYVLKTKENYYLFFDDEGTLSKRSKKCCDQDVDAKNACCYYPAIREILVQSRCRYHTEDQAWGRGYALALFDNKYPTLEAASRELVQLETCINDISGQLETSIEQQNEKDLFDVALYHGDRKLLSATRMYANETEAGEATTEIRTLFTQLDHYRIVRDKACWYRIGFGKKICPPPVCQTGPKEAFIQPKALQELFAVGGDDKAYYTYTRPEDRHYSFHIVGKDFHLARHPFDYDTLEARAEAIQKLCQRCLNTNIPEWKIYALENKTFQGAIKDKISGDILVKTLNERTKKAESTDDMLMVLDYLRDPAFYFIKNDRTFILNRRNEAGRIPELNDFNVDDPPEYAIAEIVQSGTSINHWVEQALSYPLIKREDGIAFQYYCPDFPVTGEDDTQPVNNCHPDTEQKETRGAVVWTSRQAYDSIDQAWCYFRLFLTLIKEKKNYRPIQDHCGPFGIELVYPGAIVASHPQAYHLRSEVHEAIRRTQQCIYAEGMHVMEHILVRPKNRRDNTCLLPVKPDIDCELCYDEDEVDHCKDEQPGIPDCAEVVDQNENTLVGAVTHTAMAIDDLTVVPEKEGCAEDDCPVYIPGSDPYSFLATIVLPAYAPQFRSQAAREWTQNLIYASTPLHVGLNILWLDPKDMCDFEACYHRWLLSTRCADDCYDHFNLCHIIECFKNLKSCPPPPQETTDADCGGGIIQTASISHYGWRAMLHENDDSLYSLPHLHQMMNVRGGQMTPKSLEEIRKRGSEILTAYRPICPDVKGNEGSEDFDPPVDPERERRIRKMMHQRKASHMAALDNIENRNIQRSLIYQGIKHFVQEGKNMADYTRLIEHILHQNTKLKQPLTKYEGIISIATRHMLDRMLIQDISIENIQNHILPQWRMLEAEQIDHNTVLESWRTSNINDEELKEKAELFKYRIQAAL